MTMPPHASASPPSPALRQLEQRGAVSLPGRRADVTLRWLHRRRVLMGTMLGVGGVGVLAMALGLALREIGGWALLIPVGFLLAFVGFLAWAVVGKLGRLIGGRLRAEEQPVAIDGRGFRLRGIGLVPWGWVAPPERRQVRVKNDIGGDCTVMPLTPEGHAYVNAQPGWWMNLVGPKPHLRFDIPYLLLPGIEGLTEDETLELFRIAHRRFAR